MSGERLAQVILALSMASFVIHDSFSSAIAAEISVWQFMLLRSIIVAGMIGMVLTVREQSDGRAIEQPLWSIARSVAYGITYLAFVSSLTVVPVTQAAATFFTSPLILLLIARAFMGETFGIYRTFAIMLGFVGVLVVIQPWDAELTLLALAPLVAAFFNAVGTAITRARCANDDPMTLTLVHNIVNMQMALAGLAVTGLFLFEMIDAPVLTTSWSDPPAWIWIALLGVATIHIVATVTYTQAYQRASASSLAPFEYSYLMFAPLLELALTGSPPSATTLLGVGLIAFAGVLAAKRDPDAASSPVAANTSTFAIDEEAIESPSDSGETDARNPSAAVEEKEALREAARD